MGQNSVTEGENEDKKNVANVVRYARQQTHPNRAHRFPFALPLAPFAAAAPFFFFGLSSSDSSDSPRALAASARFESAAIQMRTPRQPEPRRTQPPIRTFGGLALKLVPIVPVVTGIIKRATARILARIRTIVGTLLGTALFRDEVLWVGLELGFGVGFLLGVALPKARGSVRKAVRGTEWETAPLHHHHRGNSIRPAGRNRMDSR